RIQRSGRMTSSSRLPSPTDSIEETANNAMAMSRNAATRSRIPSFHDQRRVQPLLRADVGVAVDRPWRDGDLDPVHLAGELVHRVVGGDRRTLVTADLQRLVAGERERLGAAHPSLADLLAVDVQ